MRFAVIAATALLGLPAVAAAHGPPVVGGGPAQDSVTRDTGARFTLAYEEPGFGQRFECQLDSGPWAPCTAAALPAGEHVLGGLPDGRHEFRARRDGELFEGDPFADDTPSEARVWTVDTTGPQTTVAAPLKTVAAGRAVRIAFGASEPGTSFVCALDGAPAAPCVSPVTVRRPAAGRHRFAVAALDALGNPDTTPATVGFRVRGGGKPRRAERRKRRGAPRATAAHSPVKSTSPRRGSTVPRALRVVSVTFKSRIAGGSMTVTRKGKKVSSGRGRKDGRTTVRATLRRGLRPGPYKASWRIVASDGHVQRGSFTFRLR